MPETGSGLGVIVFLFVVAGLVAYSWVFRSRHRSTPVPDGPEGEPYRVYTTAFDLELSGDELVDALPGASLDARRGHLDGNATSWPVWTRRTDLLVAGNDEDAVALLPDLRAAMSGHESEKTVVALLIDQSGSMKGEPMARAAAEAPALTPAARAAMVHPDLLRENVDGEALLWAGDRLLAIPARHRLLLVLSDGAPVDDASMLQNGRLFLHRHLLKVVPSLAEDGLVVGGVGINHRVEDYYPLSETVTSLPELPAAVARVLTRMLRVAFAERMELG